jgi:hypothetical protein
MCPLKIQLECEERMPTPIDRLDHIEQSLVRMRPTMGYELNGAAAIRKELAALREVFSSLNHAVKVGEPAPWEDGDTCS